MPYDYDSDDCRAELDAYDRAELDVDDYGYDGYADDIIDATDATENNVDPDSGWTSSYSVTVDVTVPSRVGLSAVLDEITSNVDSVSGWSVDSIAAADTRLPMTAANVIVRALFRYVVGSFPSTDRVSTVAAIICDAVDADKALSNLHTAYHAIKAETTQAAAIDAYRRNVERGK